MLFAREALADVTVWGQCDCVVTGMIECSHLLICFEWIGAMCSNVREETLAFMEASYLFGSKKECTG
jgi:hypothetical protein